MCFARVVELVSRANTPSNTSEWLFRPALLHSWHTFMRGCVPVLIESEIAAEALSALKTQQRSHAKVSLFACLFHCSFVLCRVREVEVVVLVRTLSTRTQRQRHKLKHS